MSHYPFQSIHGELIQQNNQASDSREMSQRSWGSITNNLPGEKIPRNGVRFKVLAYQRVSVNEDQTGSHTFETQSQRIKERLNALYGEGRYDLEVLTDNGSSGAYGLAPTGVQRKTRPILQAATVKLRTQTYDCFIVYNLSRLVRSPRWFHQMLEDVIVPSGVDFISATQDLNFGNAEGRAMAGMLSVLDGLFRDSVVQRNKDAALTRAQGGYYVGQVGYGWQWEPLGEIAENGRRRIIPVPEHRQWVLQIKDWHLAGWHMTRIARELNERHIPSPSGQSRWTASVVNKVLCSRVHAGLVPVGRGGKEWIRGEHHERRFYDPEEWEQIRTVMTQRRRWKTNALKAPEHLLNTLVFCERCGQRLYISNPNDKYRAYRCTNGMAQGQRACPNVTVRADDLEQAVVRHLEQLLEQPLMRELLDEEASRALHLEESNLEEEFKRLQAQLGNIYSRFERWADAFSRGLVGEEEFVRHRKVLLEEQTAVEGRFQDVEKQLQNRGQHQAWVEQVRETLFNLPVIWGQLDDDERRQVLVWVLEKLTVERIGRDAVVKIKIHLLPEQELRIMFRSLVNVKEKPKGLHSLTPRHLAFLYYVGQGKSRREIAAVMGVRYTTASAFGKQVRDRLNGATDIEAAAMAAERIAALLPTLPLGTLQQPEVKPHSSLTPALMEVLPYIVKGATAVEIARRTGLPETTVRGRWTRIMHILGAKSVFEAAEKAQAMGLLK